MVCSMMAEASLAKKYSTASPSEGWISSVLNIKNINQFKGFYSQGRQKLFEMRKLDTYVV